MRRLQLLILIFLTACNNKDTSNKKYGKYAYDTLSNGLRIINRTIDSDYYYKDQVATDSLTGNYQIFYVQDDSSYFLYLKHRDTLNLLNKTTQYNSLHHLGKVISDEQKFFILGHDNGNGSPYSYEYIDKQSGKNLLGFGKEFLDIKTYKGSQYLLYLDTLINGNSKLILFNTDNKKKEFYEMKNIYWDLYIDTISTNNLVLLYTLDRNGDEKRRKMYSR
jgi:hypothetical protein